MAKASIDDYRAEVFGEAIAALQGLHDLAPNGPRAHQLAFSVGVLIGARDFPAMEKSSPDGADATPGFFQLNKTYSAENGAWRFRVDSITTRPEDGERVALGWRYWNGQWQTDAYGEADWEIHQIVGWDHVEGGAADE
jgi:hypothetical protein